MWGQQKVLLTNSSDCIFFTLGNAFHTMASGKIEKVACRAKSDTAHLNPLTIQVSNVPFTFHQSGGTRFTLLTGYAATICLPVGRRSSDLACRGRGSRDGWRCLLTRFLDLLNQPWTSTSNTSHHRAVASHYTNDSNRIVGDLKLFAFFLY